MRGRERTQIQERKGREDTPNITIRGEGERGHAGGRQNTS